MTTTKSDVLLIDDSDLARASMMRALNAAGISAAELSSPIGATSAILKRSVKVVVIDVNMPSMRGDKLAALFRKNKRFGDLKVVLISGTAVDQLDQLAREVRADAVLAKREGPDRLVETVKKLLVEA
jgi:CheY-like chemotaxis protein